MKLNSRWLLVTAIVLPLGMGLWSRSVASWRPQKIGTFPNAVLVQDRAHGPWIWSGSGRGAGLNAESGQRIVPFSISRSSDYWPSFSPDGRSLAILSVEGDKKSAVTTYLYLREVASGRVVRRFNTFWGDRTSNTFQFSPDGANLLIPTPRGIWKLPLDGSKATRVPLPETTRVCLSEDGRRVCAAYNLPSSAAKAVELRIFDAQTGRLRQTVRDGRELPRDFYFSPDGALLCVSDSNAEGDEGGIWICDAKSGHRLWDFAANCTCEFSPDGTTLVAFNFDDAERSLQLRAARTGELLSTFQLPNAIDDVRFSSDGHSIFVIDGSSTVWKLRVR